MLHANLLRINELDWAISTAVAGSCVFPSVSHGIFNDDGTIFYRVRDYRIYKMVLVTAYDITASTSDTIVLNTSANITDVSGICWAKNGTKLLLSDVLKKEIFQYDLASPKTIDGSTVYSGYSFSTASQTINGLRSIEVDDGTNKLFACDSGGTGYIYRYTLGVGGDLSTAPTYDGNSTGRFTFADVAGLPTSAAWVIRFSLDRKVMFLVAINSNVYQLKLTSPAEWSGATYSGESVSAGYAARDMSINPDKTGFVLTASNRLCQFTTTLK